MKPTPSEQLHNFAIQQEVGDIVRETQKEFRKLDQEIADLRLQLSAAQERAEKAEALLRETQPFLTPMLLAGELEDATLPHRVDAALKQQEQG